MYEVVPLVKLGDNVPAENDNAVRFASDDKGSRVITVEYVFVVVPSSAVTLTSTVFAPTESETEDVPETSALKAPAEPSRYSAVAFESDFVPVMVTEVVV